MSKVETISALDHPRREEFIELNTYDNLFGGRGDVSDVIKQISVFTQLADHHDRNLAVLWNGYSQLEIKGGFAQLR